MATIVVPFRSGGKSRLPVELRAEVALAMLRDAGERMLGPGRMRLYGMEADGRVVAALIVFAAGGDAMAVLIGPPADGFVLSTQPLVDAKKISFHNYDDTRHRELIDPGPVASAYR